MGGIWRARNGPAADSQGNLYFMTGNGTFDAGRERFGNTIVKLNGDLSLVDWFAPANVKALNLLGYRLGSVRAYAPTRTDELVGGGRGKVILLPSSRNSGGQQQRRWLRDDLNPPVQAFQASRRWRISFTELVPISF